MTAFWMAVVLTLASCGPRGQAGIQNGEIRSATILLAIDAASCQRMTREYIQWDVHRAGMRRTYRQHLDDLGRVEGSLLGRIDRPLSEYLDPHSNRPNRPRLDWPRKNRRVGYTFFVEFDPPVPEFPDDLTDGGESSVRANMKAYDGDGVPFTSGKISRRVWVDGTESVSAGGRAYANCLRLAAETELRFGWWATVRLQETFWLSPDAGVVRRNEHIGGSALLLILFDSNHQYDLVEPTVDDTRGTAPPQSPTSSKCWSRLAVQLQPGPPHPRVAGLAVEWSDEQTNIDAEGPNDAGQSTP